MNITDSYSLFTYFVDYKREYRFHSLVGNYLMIIALVIPNAIAITTYRKEYIFRSFWDRDEAFNMLKDLVNKYKGIDTVTSDSDANMDMSVSGPTTRPASESVTSITTETSGVTPKRNSTILQPLEGSQDLQSRPVSIPHQNLSNAQTSNNTPPTPVPMTPVKQNSESKLKAVDDNELDTGEIRVFFLIVCRVWSRRIRSPTWCNAKF